MTARRRLRRLTGASHPGEGRSRGTGSVAPLPGVLLHRLVDEVIDAALELARHLLERLPEHVPALEIPRALLVRVRAHLVSYRSIKTTCISPECTSGARRPARHKRSPGTTRQLSLLARHRRHHAVLREVPHGHDRLRLGVLRSPAFGIVARPAALVVLVALGDGPACRSRAARTLLDVGLVSAVVRTERGELRRPDLSRRGTGVDQRPSASAPPPGASIFMMMPPYGDRLGHPHLRRRRRRQVPEEVGHVLGAHRLQDLPCRPPSAPSTSSARRACRAWAR